MAAFLFNLGQGVLRPSLPLYVQRTFAANDQKVTLIPVVFGAGKWAASMPAGYLVMADAVDLSAPFILAGILLALAALACHRHAIAVVANDART